MVGDTLLPASATSFGITDPPGTAMTGASQVISAAFAPGPFTTFWQVTVPDPTTPADFRGDIVQQWDFAVSCP